MKEAVRIAKGILLVVMLAFAPIALPTTSRAQDNDNNKSVKQDVKDAGHSTKKAAQKTGKTVAKDTKKGVNKGAQKTGEAADKVQDKTKTNP